MGNSDTPESSQTQVQRESALGKDYIGRAGAFAIVVYLILFAITDLYVVVKVWPPAPNQVATATPTPTPTPTLTPAASPTASPTPSASPSPTATRATLVLTAAASPTPSPSVTPASGGNPKPTPSASPTPVPQLGADQAQAPWTVDFFWDTYTLTTNSALFLIVMFCGSLGSLLHALRSFYWYTGNRKLIWSWASMYILLPFSGGLLAIVFYLIVRGGFMPQQNLGSANTFAFAALGALVGLFSEEATLKLKQVAATVFTAAETGKDSAAPPPKLSGVSPATGPAVGGTAVTITGSNFNPGAKVNFGGAAATVGVITKTSIAVTTPAHALGPVDVEVINPDNHNDVLRSVFTYQ